jgi:hypothetical protein
MIYRNVELHNVAETQTVDGGERLQRVPESVRKHLNEAAQQRVLFPANCEIRYVCDSQKSRVTLSSEGETYAVVFFGSFDSRQRHVIGRTPVTIDICPAANLEQLDRRWWAGQPFSPRVCRIIFGGRRRDPVIVHDIEAEGIRPPNADEVPALRYLACGTSITQGVDAEAAHLSYVAQTAWHLGADCINLGVGGSCYCEREFADYIAGRTDWNIATLALSVNMQSFALDEFSKRVNYIVNTVAGADTARPVACITLYPYFRDWGIDDSIAHPDHKPEDYRQELRDAVARCPHPNVHLIEGPDLLKNIGGLTADLIHPSDNAMIEIGRNLYERLRFLVRN